MPGQKDAPAKRMSTTSAVSEAESEEGEEDDADEGKISQADSQTPTLLIAPNFQDLGGLGRVPKPPEKPPWSESELPTVLLPMIPSDYVDLMAGKAKKKPTAEKQVLFRESELPTVLLTPEQANERENKQRQQRARETKSIRRTSTRTPVVESDTPTAMIAPSDYVDYMKDCRKKSKLAGRKTPVVVSDLPTALIARRSSNYNRFYPSKDKKIVKKTSRARKTKKEQKKQQTSPPPSSEAPKTSPNLQRKSPRKHAKKNVKKKRNDCRCSIL